MSLPPPIPVGRKDDEGKPRWDLLPPLALVQVVAVLTYGAYKYEPDGWRHVSEARWRYFRAALGHLFAWWMGEEIDAESGLPHLAHAACCVLFLLELFSGRPFARRDAVYPAPSYSIDDLVELDVEEETKP